MLPAGLAIGSHSSTCICIFINFLFGFKSGVWLLIPPNPVHCFSIRKRLLTDVCQLRKVGKFAADRRLSLAKGRNFLLTNVCQ